MPTLTGYFTLIAPHVIDVSYAPQFTFSPTTADLNGDGNQDLIVLGASYPVNGVTYPPTPQPGRVFFGDGKGGFTAVPDSIFPQSTMLTVHPRKVLTADFNGDGRQDVFISSHGWDATPFPGEQNQLYISQPNGSWINATSALPQVSDYSHSSSVGDINHDGKIDIFVGDGYGDPSKTASYVLLNNGSGQFALTRDVIPTGAGSILDYSSGHTFPGSTLVDLNNDSYPELIIDADATANFNRNTQTTILWNHAGVFTEADKTLLPANSSLAAQIVTDTQAIDFNGDGLKDLVTIGTQGQPFYDGWFVQLLQNNGNKTFTDVTASALSASDTSGGKSGVSTGSPWAIWLKVGDFNSDGLPDFAVEYNGGQLSQTTPLIWLNGGDGRFTTIKVGDIVAPGNEWQIGSGLLVQTKAGYSFITTQEYPGSGGLVETGLLATQALPSAVASLITDLFVSYYNRAPDPGGLLYWIKNYTMPGGGNPFYQDIGHTSAAFADPAQSETIALYPFLAHPEKGVYTDAVKFITDAYSNMFARTVDGADQGVRYWATSIAKSLGIAVPTFGDPVVDHTAPIPAANALIALIFGAQGNDALTIANKVTVGRYYETQLVANNVAFTQDSAHKALAGVTFAPSTVLTAEANIDAFIATAPHVTAASSIPLIGIGDPSSM